MFPSRHDIIARFADPAMVPHPLYPQGVTTFSCLREWNEYPKIELPRLRIQIRGIDYLKCLPEAADTLLLRFQQDCFRLWFQIDGHGILQNTSANVFASARPGLVGIMERSQRHTYLHQKGTFECFQILFTLEPSASSKCFWNSAIEGKTVLAEAEFGYFENLVFDLLLVLANRTEPLGLSHTARLLEILVVLFKKRLLLIEESQFPKNKAGSLVAKARVYMETHYATLHHQRDLARECGVDINYLNVIFRRQTGATLYDHLSRIRFEQAKHLLETTAVPVSEIASRVGYPNANSFSRAFRHRERQTPLAYRRAALRPGGRGHASTARSTP